MAKRREVRHAAVWALGHLRTGGYYDAAPVPEPVRPAYPLAAFRRGITGVVLVEVLVGEAGEIAHTEVRESIPEPDAAALDCVRQWKFRPATRQNRAVAVVVHVPVTFDIRH